MRILIDMDDVLADTSLKILNETNKRLGTNFTREQINTQPEIYKAYYEQYTTVRGMLWEKGFFADIPLIKDAQEVVQKLHAKHEIFIVSAATEFPLSMEEKLEWLDKYFPYIGWSHTVFCGHKWMIKADYIIDDHEKNLINFEGKGLLFDARHNQHVKEFTRVLSWKEIEGILL